MADFNGTAHAPAQAQAGLGERPAKAYTRNAVNATAVQQVVRLLAQADFEVERTFEGGAQITFVMRARVTSMGATYVKWISVNEPDPLMALAFNQTGYTPAQLSDVAVHSKVVR